MHQSMPVVAVAARIPDEALIDDNNIALHELYAQHHPRISKFVARHGKQVGDSLGALRTSLQGVTDAASASTALPRLQEVTTQVDKVTITSMVEQLSPEQRKFMVGLVGPAMVDLNQLFDKVLAIPGVGEVLKPTIDTLKTKLAVLTV